MIPGSVKSIGDRAFRGCTNLTSACNSRECKKYWVSCIYWDCHAIETVKLTGKLNTSTLASLLGQLPRGIKLDLKDCDALDEDQKN